MLPVVKAGPLVPALESPAGEFSQADRPVDESTRSSHFPSATNATGPHPPSAWLAFLAVCVLATEILLQRDANVLNARNHGGQARLLHDQAIGPRQPFMLPRKSAARRSDSACTAGRRAIPRG